MTTKSLPRKPFYTSIAMMFWLPLLILFLNIVLTIMLGIKTINEYRIDKLFHIFGGVSISFSAAGILWYLIRRKIVKLHDANVFRVLVFGFLCFTVIAWEILEYILQIEPDYLTYTDTISDMICGLIGGLSAMLFLRKLGLDRNCF